MDDPGQSEGRKENGAIPPGKPDAATSREAVRRTGEREQAEGGPDGGDPEEIGDTFKHAPG